MWTRDAWNSLSAFGCLLGAAAVIFRHDLFPESARYGHWFWIGIVGFVLYVTGKLIYHYLRDRTAEGIGWFRGVWVNL